MAALGDRIARNVAAERVRRQWTQEQLAAQIDLPGWSRNTVQGIESGRRKVLANDLAILARAFGITLAKLADGTDPDDLAALGIN